MAGRLYRMAKVVSANPASWGIVDANQISGFRTVATLDDLYSIAACILSSSYGDGIATGADAVGQIWHVQEHGGTDYRLIDWANRDNENGWRVEHTSKQLETLINNQIQNVQEIASNAEGIATTAASMAKANANAITSKADATTVTGLSTKVNGIEGTVSTHTQNIVDINTRLGKKAEKDDVSTLMNTVDGITAELTAFKGTAGQKDGLAQLDSEGFVPLSQLGNLDTTLFEAVSELPSTIANIKKHIYLNAAGTTGDKNNYAEYIYTGDLTSTATYDATKWEKLGEVTASVDLSGYYTKAEIDKKVTAINKNSISSLFIDKQDSTDAISVVLKRAGGENTLSAPIPVVNNDLDDHHNGLMSPAMLTKLNGITTGANNYTHPVHTAYDSGLYKITVDDLGHVSAATLVDKADIKSLAPDLTVTQTGSELTQDIKITYNDADHIARLLSATNNQAGLLSSTNKKKLDGIAEGATKNIVDGEVKINGANAVSGKAVWNHVYNYKIHGDNVGNEVNGTSYTIVARNDDNNMVDCLTDVLTLNYDATNHSNLVVDRAIVWDEVTLKAISNDELTKILV